MNAEEIESEIRDAFQNVQLDGGISLRQAQVIDNRGEGVTDGEFANLPQQEITEDWTALSPELLEEYPIIPHLDAKGFRYYIPAFILSVLVDYDSFSESASSTLMALYPKNGDSWEHSMQQYSLLDAKQRTAVAHFLQAIPHIVDLDYDDGKHTERALRNFWHEYV